MGNNDKCPYIRGKSPKRVHCAEGCFVHFMTAKARNEFYYSRCLGRQDKCNVYKALREREALRRGGDDE